MNADLLIVALLVFRTLFGRFRGLWIARTLVIGFLVGRARWWRFRGTRLFGRARLFLFALFGLVLILKADDNLRDYLHVVTVAIVFLTE